MKFGRWMLVVCLFAMSAAAVSAEEKSDKKSGDITSKLEAQERATWEAIKSRDMAGFQAMIDKEAIGADVTGFWPASQMAEMMKDYELRDYELSSFKSLKIDNDAYILTYAAKQDASYKGQPVPTEVYVSTVFAKRGNKWLAVFHQETPSMAAMASGGHDHQH
jgi:hypothetical protein